jgi:hypothetical protein
MKEPPAHGDAIQSPPETVFDDPELIQIAAIEANNFHVDPEAKPHKLVSTARRLLRHASKDDRNILYPSHEESCLHLRVSKTALSRALDLMNAIILKLENEKFTVSVQKGPDSTGVEIFGQRVTGLNYLVQGK